MTRYFKYIFLLLTGTPFAIAPVTCHAQYQTDSMVAPPAEEDSIEAMLDSLSGYHTGSADDGTKHDTLFFLGKEYPSSPYDSSAIQSRFVPDTVTQELKANKSFWYANKDMPTQKNNTNGNSWAGKLLGVLITILSSPVFRQLMWLLMLVLFSAAVIWFLIQNKMNLFGSRKAAALLPQIKEGDTDNIFTVNLQKAAAAAAAEGDYRMALRFSYLHLLKVFSQNGLIRYTADATNSDYLTQLYTKPFYNHFFRVTRGYEYTWYGEMPVSRAQYENIQHDFSLLYQKAGIFV
ncbi:MAG TPA: hypothetical protein PLL71_11380 [Agriterribacter sp.]|nr:hypothetical protein [Agriterribacter sp.]HRQ51200.1 hypothetical protein [Agriterribacter sp.]